MTSAIPEIEFLAHSIVNECSRYYDAFRSFTGIARYQFEHRHWHDQRKANIHRLNLAGEHLEYCGSLIAEFLGDKDPHDYWKQITEIAGSQESSVPRPILKSFIKGIERRLYPVVKQHNLNEGEGFDGTKTSQEIVQLHFDKIDESAAKSILRIPRLNCQFGDLESDCIRFCKSLLKILPNEKVTMHLFPNLFYRNEHAYLIGKIITKDIEVPLGIAFVNHDTGIRADAFFFSEEEIIRIFEFTRSYILAHTGDPEGLIAFLHQVMPEKNIEQLILNLGYLEWGKSLIYHKFTLLLEDGKVHLDHAPGIRGMVMLVFTDSEYPLVFKLIRSDISYPKETTPEKVLDKYKFVGSHDRVGRLADTQLFEYWSFPKSVFSDRLLGDLKKYAQGSIEMGDKDITFHNLFTERKMVPLNLFLESADEDTARQVIIDYGKAIKDLAMSNIFPGDLLPKNFGVTHENRVVFYDYDEVLPLTECNFKKLPVPRNDEELLDHESWTVAHDNDIFPEELEKFIVPLPFRDLFRSQHEELFDIEFWNYWKKFHEMQGFIDLQPY